MPYALYLSVSAVVSVALGAASYYVIERRFLRRKVLAA